MAVWAEAGHAGLKIYKQTKAGLRGIKLQ